MSDKEAIARIFYEIASILDLKGENTFKVRAFESAARTLLTLTDIPALVNSGEIKKVKGFGQKIVETLTDIIQTGSSSYYADLKASIPEGLMDMLKIPGLGPKKINHLYTKLGIKSIEELEHACLENQLLTLEHFGLKTQENILIGIKFLKKHSGSHLLSTGMAEAENLANQLKKTPGVTHIEIAGSIRRRKEVIKDIDIVIACDNPEQVMDYFVSMADVENVIAKGETKSSITLTSGINCDLRVITEQEFPYALHHFTGSKEHNTALRGRAKKMEIKINEYGLFKDDGSNIPCKNEHEFFAALGLKYIPPELRENMGEIEASEQNILPTLVNHQDIKGVLHCHSTWSDGSATIEEMASQCKHLGYSYLGITDHSAAAAYARGLTRERLLEYWAEIDLLNAKLAPFKIFKGIEIDILDDGALDYDADTHQHFDFIIASVHSRFNQSRKDMTARICAALRNPYVTMLGHPTGRLLLSREEYAVDMDAVLACAAANGKAIELNANPHRLDLDWRYCRKAKELGITIFINPDAHNTESISYIDIGVDIARKGWLEKSDVGNCMDAGAIGAYFAGSFALRVKNRTEYPHSLD